MVVPARDLSARLRRIRSRVIESGVPGFRVVLPGSDRPVPGPVHRNLVDALQFARIAGASVCTVIEVRTDGALLFETGRTEWLLSWHILPVAEAEGGSHSAVRAKRCAVGG